MLSVKEYLRYLRKGHEGFAPPRTVSPLVQFLILLLCKFVLTFRVRESSIASINILNPTCSPYVFL